MSRSSSLFVLATLLATQILGSTACDDPVPGPIGGLILTIRSFEATSDAELKAIKSVEIHTERVEM